MAKSKRKYYVVWKGVRTGVFDSWEICKQQVEGFPSPLYKSFNSLEEAEVAFTRPAEEFLAQKKNPLDPIFLSLYGKPIYPSIAVDGACSGKTRLAEYQGVDTASGTQIFHQGPFVDGTNNTMEYLALVHALALCQQQTGWQDLPIYSDSVNAIKWVKAKKCRTKLEKTALNQELFDLLERADKWLKNNTYRNQILKWETQAWGEIPADFGRK